MKRNKERERECKKDILSYLSQMQSPIIFRKWLYYLTQIKPTLTAWIYFLPTSSHRKSPSLFALSLYCNLLSLWPLACNFLFSLKKFSPLLGFEPRTSRYQADMLPTELSWQTGNNFFLIKGKKKKKSRLSKSVHSSLLYFHFN